MPWKCLLSVFWFKFQIEFTSDYAAAVVAVVAGCIGLKLANIPCQKLVSCSKRFGSSLALLFNKCNGMRSSLLSITTLALRSGSAILIESSLTGFALPLPKITENQFRTENEMRNFYVLNNYTLVLPKITKNAKNNFILQL